MSFAFNEDRQHFLDSLEEGHYELPEATPNPKPDRRYKNSKLCYPLEWPSGMRVVVRKVTNRIKDKKYVHWEIREPDGLWNGEILCSGLKEDRDRFDTLIVRIRRCRDLRDTLARIERELYYYSGEEILDWLLAEGKVNLDDVWTAANAMYQKEQEDAPEVIEIDEVD